MIDTIYYACDFNYRRLLALSDIATALEYKQEVIGGGLSEYLITGPSLLHPKNRC